MTTSIAFRNVQDVTSPCYVYPAFVAIKLATNSSDTVWKVTLFQVVSGIRHGVRSGWIQRSALKRSTVTGIQ